MVFLAHGMDQPSATVSYETILWNFLPVYLELFFLS